jgi:hypothetical protein
MTAFSWSPQDGLDPTPGEARKWLADELNGQPYGQSWLSSLTRWVADRLASLFDAVGRAADSGLSLLVTVLVAFAVIALLVWVLPKVRRESVVAGPDGAVLDDLTITAETYRKLAAQALADGRYDGAVLDGFRAIAKDMSDRTLLDDAPGRTAHEVSLTVGRAFPAHAGRLAQAADVFDAVRYGHRRATADQANQIRQLDTELIGTRPVLTSSLPREIPV